MRCVFRRKNVIPGRASWTLPPDTPDPLKLMMQVGKYFGYYTAGESRDEHDWEFAVDSEWKARIDKQSEDRHTFPSGPCNLAHVCSIPVVVERNWR